MVQPEGYINKDMRNFVCKLKKSLNSLKQAPRVWYQVLREWLEKNGFTMLDAEACVGVKIIDGAPCFISIYVNELILFATKKEIIDSLKQILTARFRMKELGELHYILRWEVKRNRSKRLIVVSQRKYAEKSSANLEWLNVMDVTCRAIQICSCPRSFVQIMQKSR